MSEFKVDWVRDEIAFVRFFLSALSLSLSPTPPVESLFNSLSHTPSSIVARDIIITVINDKQTRPEEDKGRERERKRKEKFQTRELNEFLCPPKKNAHLRARDDTSRDIIRTISRVPSYPFAIFIRRQSSFSNVSRFAETTRFPLFFCSLYVRRRVKFEKRCATLTFFLLFLRAEQPSRPEGERERNT